MPGRGPGTPDEHSGAGTPAAKPGRPVSTSSTDDGWAADRGSTPQQEVPSRGTSPARSHSCTWGAISRSVKDRTTSR